MSKKNEKFDNLEKKLKLKDKYEGVAVVEATQLLLAICNENGLHFIACSLSRLQLKIIYKEVEYSG